MTYFDTKDWQCCNLNDQTKQTTYAHVVIRYHLVFWYCRTYFCSDDSAIYRPYGFLTYMEAKPSNQMVAPDASGQK